MSESILSEQNSEHHATVLVAEDDPILRSTLSLELREAGYHVREAGTTEEADVLLESDAAIDILITDIEMPGDRDGLALARAVRAFRPQIPVIVVSGNPPAKGVVGVADAFFGKPYDFDRLVGRVGKLLSTRPSGGHS